jgi:hypothetical protein
MPRKEFESFTRLDASDVNTYLMDQSVMTFAGTAARGSAIGTAVEGMVTYLEDSNSLQLYDGDAWTSAGGVSSGNAIINGAFEINQRNFTSGTAGGYGFDRWNNVIAGDGTATFSSQVFTPGSTPEDYIEPTNFCRIVTTGQTSASVITRLQQPIENVKTFAGQTVTLSFWAKVASGNPDVSLEIGRSFGTGGSPTSPDDVYLGQVTLTGGTTWTRYSITSTLPSVSGATFGTTPNTSSLAVRLWVSAGSSFNARTNSLGIQSNTFDIWGVQLEAGPVATPFRRNANSIAGELAACQRYYYKTAVGGGRYGVGFTKTTTTAEAITSFPNTMRVAPSGLEQSGTPADYSVVHQNTSTALSAVPAFNNANVNMASTNLTVASGLTAGNGCALSAASGNAFLAWSAEL